MPRGKPLNSYERGQIDALRSEAMTIAEIARRIKRSERVVRNYINLGDQYGAKKSSGRPKVTDKRTDRQIVNCLKQSGSSLSKVKNDLGLQISRSTIWNRIHNDSSLRHGKLLQKPKLTKFYQLARMEFAKKHVTFGDQWKNVIFSDEKRFCLDGPDGYACYWHDIGAEPKVVHRRQSRGAT